MTSEYKKAIILPDIHVPFQDDKAIDLTMKLIKKYKPEKIVQLGDAVDFYSLSRFDKNPERIDGMQEEIDMAHNLLKRYRQQSKKSEFAYLEGNHESRLKKYLWRNPELNCLDALKIENLLRLDKIKVDFYPSEDMYYITDDLIATHGATGDGCKLSQYSGYSAKNTLQKVGINGLSGHSHRLAAYYQRDFSGQKQWYECGCLCELDPEYCKKPNWQQGFGLVKYNNKEFDINLIPIHQDDKYWCIVDGKKYKV